MNYPDPARCRFPGAVTIEPPTCHCGRPLARVVLRFTAPDGRQLTDSYWRHVPARNPKRPGDLAAEPFIAERTWTGYVGAGRIKAGASCKLSTGARIYPALWESDARTARRWTAHERFATHYVTGIKPSECWLWIGSLGNSNAPIRYGQFMLDGRRTTAHRAAWRLFRGPVADGLDVMHLCDEHLCVNPDHLALGTRSENQRHAAALGRWRFKGIVPRKLGPEDALEIRRLHAQEGLSRRELAERYGVSPTHVGLIIRGRKWPRADQADITPEPGAYRQALPSSTRIGAGGRIPLYASLDALHAAGFGARP